MRKSELGLFFGSRWNGSYLSPVTSRRQEPSEFQISEIMQKGTCCIIIPISEPLPGCFASRHLKFWMTMFMAITNPRGDIKLFAFSDQAQRSSGGDIFPWVFDVTKSKKQFLNSRFGSTHRREETQPFARLRAVSISEPRISTRDRSD